MRRTLRFLKNAHPLLLEGAEATKFKGKVLGKRHTILHKNVIESMVKIQDTSVSTPLKDFQAVAKRFPKIEDKFVEEISHRLSEEEQKEIKLSLLERRRLINRKSHVSIMKAQQFVEAELEPDDSAYEYKIPDPNNPTENDIGKFYCIPEEIAKKFYTNGCFGEYIKDHYSKCDTFDIMLREETLGVINMLKASQNINAVNYPDLQDTSVIDGLQPMQKFGWLIRNHPQTYLTLYKKISWIITDYVYSVENLDLYNIVRNSADLVNSTAGIITQELAKTQLFNAICKESFADHKGSVEKIANSESSKKQSTASWSFTIKKS